MELHNSNYIQGDVRALNCIFAGRKSAMIDFDFGGTKEDYYPPGYATLRPDGRRSVNVEKKEETHLSKQLNIKALRYVLGVLHDTEDWYLTEGSMEQLLNGAKWTQMKNAASLEEMKKILETMPAKTRVVPD
mmetsp:Transcript_12906/g.19743  ORF Transcript_12906/g.19743 Transcript_12906/m.19743 type:complete len:132 (+) Transcript_12906:1059-1454(+)